MSRIESSIVKKKKNAGQAVVEYLLLFGFMAVIVVQLTKALGDTMGGTMGKLAFTLSHHLSIGVCKANCFSNSFKNNVGQ